ncbi:hypothetical protein GS506_13445 [Rhodococcus hoagii]|nr:hypothetical protein [Prescottella equi]
MGDRRDKISGGFPATARSLAHSGRGGPDPGATSTLRRARTLGELLLNPRRLRPRGPRSEHAPPAACDDRLVRVPG